MPTLTGTLADVTGTELQPAQIKQVYVKAPANRPSLADGDLLIVTARVTLEPSGILSVDLEPGPAVLVVDTYAGGPDVYELHVTADMSMLAEAVAESAPAHERSWAESVMVQLRDEAVAAADRAEAAAGDVDSAIAGAADQVVAAVEGDRVAAEAAALAAGGSAVAAAGSASAASSSASAAAGSATSAGSSATAAAGSASDADASATAAAGSESAASGHAGTATTQAGVAEGHAQSAASSASSAATDAGRAETAANSFDLSVTTTTGAPGSNAAVTVSGDGPAYTLGFTVPQGAKGDKGDDGEVSQAALDAAVASLVDNAPEALDTLTELAAALGNDPNFATTTATAIGQRALIDGAPAAYDTLGKLVTALQNHELGGSTDASLLTGALTDQVDASEAMVTYSAPPSGDPVTFTVEQILGQAAYTSFLVENVVGPAIDSKADADHTHPVSDVEATGTASSTTFLRGDGSWATPPDTNTTYAVPTQAEAEAGTATTGRAFSAQRVRQAADAAITAREWQGTQAQYDALPTKNPNVTYWIV